MRKEVMYNHVVIGEINGYALALYNSISEMFGINRNKVKNIQKLNKSLYGFNYGRIWK